MIKGISAPSIPHLVHVETTYACNQNCLFCYNPKRNDKINQATIDRIVERVYESHIPHVYLIGGEPSLLGVRTLNKHIELLSERSSVTIVTNGQIYLDGISNKLACIGVPVHGREDTHDFLTGKRGSFRQAMESVRRYVSKGFDVRCIPVLTRLNFDQMYEVIGLAKSMGMESVFVDRFEDGGLGSQKADQLKPSLDDFRTALGQMIKGRDDFSIPVGWGTAIPFCLDSRMITENMTAGCGAGVTFAALNPNGEVRACNQSEKIYGNILAESMSDIWKKPALKEFRGLSWVESPCTSCRMIADCLCGCKVDASCPETYSVDYAVRGNGSFTIIDQPISWPRETACRAPQTKLRSFRPNRYMRINDAHKEIYLVTRYQTIEIDELGYRMLKQIMGGTSSETALMVANAEDIENGEIRKFVSILAEVGAIDILQG